MQKLTIRANTTDAAERLTAALRGSLREMNPNAVGGYDITAIIEENPAQLASILTALQSYVIQRHEAAAIQLNGHRYILEANSQALAAKTDFRAAHV